ncbi:HAD family hydrolase [Planktotalea arctica]|uniref:sulfotransferase-like domain-containing protein n=1 Tax=Planktotalea arctica TaxID=1481893 RepID=UPI003219FD80
MRIAMWSGPRNLSTALMYSFANRMDMSAVDEPFYAAYLNETGLDHPMRKEVILSQNVDPKLVVSALFEADTAVHSYQKHMTQHMLPCVLRDWMREVTNVFLIRHPARVLASFANKYDGLTLADIGFVQQLELFDQVCAFGQVPVVIDSDDIRANPERALRALCHAIGLEWDPEMLSWPAGPKPFDGVWASHWYDAVHRSTGFADTEGELPVLSGELQVINEKALPIYERLAAHKLSI